MRYINAIKLAAFTRDTNTTKMYVAAIITHIIAKMQETLNKRFTTNYSR